MSIWPSVPNENESSIMKVIHNADALVIKSKAWRHWVLVMSLIGFSATLDRTQKLFNGELDLRNAIGAGAMLLVSVFWLNIWRIEEGLPVLVIDDARVTWRRLFSRKVTSLLISDIESARMEAGQELRLRTYSRVEHSISLTDLSGSMALSVLNRIRQVLMTQ